MRTQDSLVPLMLPAVLGLAEVLSSYRLLLAALGDEGPREIREQSADEVGLRIP